jgi:sulfate adenylyltransferase
VTSPRDHSALHVLFVCTANICRSPYMELVTRQRLGDAGVPEAVVTVASAGTHGWVDKKMSRTMAATLPGGIRHREFLSRSLTREMVDEADLVLTAERSHRQFVLEEFPAAFRKVFTLGQFAEVVRRSPGATGRDLIKVASTLSGIAQHREDVADPYAKGPEAAAVCAGEIGVLLDIVLPALPPT